MASSRSGRSSPASHAAESLDGFMTRVNEMYDSMQEFIGTARQDRQEKGHYKAEFRQTRKRAHDLETELEKYQEQIFRSINPFQVSDTSISGELTSIQASLSNWIETLPDSERFVQNWPEVHKLLEDNGFVTHNSTLIPEVIGLAEAELLKTVAFGILWTILFKPSLLGSPSDICTFLDVVQANMPLLEPKKDRAAINSWRSDMFRAWSRSSEYARIAEAESRQASDILIHALKLGGLINDGNWESRTNQLSEQILKPATALAMQMRCSLEDYSWDWAPEIPDKVQKDHLSTWQCVDLRTHRQINCESLRNNPGSYVVGDSIITIFPALYRLIDGEQNRLLIGKGQLLVNTSAPITRTKEEPKSPKPTQDGFLWSQVKEEPASPKLTQSHSATQSEPQPEPSVASQVPSQGEIDGNP